MAKTIITLTIMPEDAEQDLARIEKEAKQMIAAFAGQGDMKTEVKPVAFGLESVNITFVSEESKGGTEKLEKEIASIEGVQNCETTDVRRAIG